MKKPQLIVFLIILAIAAFQPYFEAKTYNKFLKNGSPRATYLDAVFGKLRIQN